MRRDVFNAIADPTRRSILMSLTSESQNVNALAEKFDMTRQAVSLHVKYLQECGVISIQKAGRERYCNLEIQKLHEVSDWLEPFRKLWEDRFDRMDSVLEKLKNQAKK
ncbi:ArsR/SmtB family transcription factor [Galbibacter pacificus]|uniref:Metalloregulator ArsR/SmtB family transcription factor n=1 Tax=Galbibacter pacificus TaxID=2996052 RepID=A0ABT6FWW8_9FLAO|nr:metalloregulator ArsR/SmtB family transcription factor [Galbibacter pacificus]MDG3584185.1 metalloregulator ArsR/SmtB family transcription factor [Galbibacter pacificus]MDG3587634.1 metalloregulator ArsR/SmtB family transcription factor [Galbibacter pacificus]